MALQMPYKMQIYVPDDVREVLKQIAHRKRVSLQQLMASHMAVIAAEAEEGREIVLDEDDKRLTAKP